MTIELKIMLGVSALGMLIVLVLFGLHPLLSWAISTQVPEEPYDTQLEALSLRGYSQRSPQWTPDGAHVVFGHWPRVYAVDSAGLRLQDISANVPENHWAHSPSVSPDGSRVAFITTDSSVGRSSSEVVSTELEGSDLHSLTENQVWDWHPIWSPDGNRIAFVSDSEVFTMATDGTDMQPVAPSISVDRRPPVWSPTGQSLAMLGDGVEIETECRADRGFLILKRGLYISGAVGDAPREIGRVTGPALLSWPPDSRRLRLAVYSEEDCEHAEIQSVTQDGARANVVLLLPRYFGETGASWSPDGSMILIGSTLVRVDSSEARSVSAPRGHSSWSPNGSRIAVHLARDASGASWSGYSGPAVLYSMAADGSDIRVLVEKDEEGNLSAANGRRLSYTPSESEQRHQCLEFSEQGVLKYCE